MEEEEVLGILSQDPGNSLFADYAEALRKEGQNNSAIIVCLRGLSVNPSCHKGRLLLARIFYDSGFRPFAIEQIRILQQKLPDNPAIKKLLEKFSLGAEVTSPGSTTEATVAEAEFDFNEIDLIEEDK